MTFAARRRLFYALVALFLVLGTGVVLYAQGWRFDFATGHVDKVGAIYLQTFPAGAAISLDGAPVQSQVGFLTRGTLITDLFPRIYDVQLTAPGYDDWHENASVSPSLVTELKDAVLVPSVPIATDDATGTASTSSITATTSAAASASTTVALFLSAQKTIAAADASNTAATMVAAGIVLKKGVLTIGNSTAAASSSLTPTALPGLNKKIALIRNGLLGILQSDGSLYIYDTGTRGTEGRSALRKFAGTVTDFSVADDGSLVAALEHTSVEVFSLDDPGIYYRFNIPDVGDVQKLIWYKDRSHLFVVYKNSVAFLDLADAGLRNFTTVATLADGSALPGSPSAAPSPSSALPAYDPQTNSLYVTAAVAGQNRKNAVMRFDFPQQ